MTRLKMILLEKKMSQKDLAKLSDVEEYKISLLCRGSSKRIAYINGKKNLRSIES
jgi:DNA-binding Xre family transcriptional regulator